MVKGQKLGLTRVCELKKQNKSIFVKGRCELSVPLRVYLLPVLEERWKRAGWQWWQLPGSLSPCTPFASAAAAFAPDVVRTAPSRFFHHQHLAGWTALLSQGCSQWQRRQSSTFRLQTRYSFHILWVVGLQLIPSSQFPHSASRLCRRHLLVWNWRQSKQC